MPPVDSDNQPPNASQERRQCMCAKDSCDKLRLQILIEAPDDHPWRVGNGFTEIRHHATKFSLKVEALRKSCAFHLNINATDSAKAKYRVAQLHWPVALLKERKYRSFPISGAEAKKHDEMAGYTSRFFADRNKIGHILKKFDDPLFRQDKKNIAELYVQAPVCTRAEVKAEIESMTSVRATRRENTEVLKAERSLSLVASPFSSVALPSSPERPSSPLPPPSIDSSKTTEAADTEIEVESALAEEVVPITIDPVNESARTELPDVRAGLPLSDPVAERATTPDPLPLLEVTKYLCRKFDEFDSDEQKLRSHPRARPFLNHLNYTLEETSIRLNPKTLLILCPNYGGDGCLQFSTRIKDMGKETPCDHCAKILFNTQRKANRKRISLEAGLDHTDPSSKTALSLLSPGTMIKRYEQVQKRVRRLELELKKTIS